MDACYWYEALSGPLQMAINRADYGLGGLPAKTRIKSEFRINRMRGGGGVVRERGRLSRPRKPPLTSSSGSWIIRALARPRIGRQAGQAVCSAP